LLPFIAADLTDGDGAHQDAMDGFVLELSVGAVFKTFKFLLIDDIT
jgi:hypothetical protein